MWAAFLARSDLSIAPSEFRVVVADLEGFLLPPSTAAARGVAFEAVWGADGFWNSGFGDDG